MRRVKITQSLKPGILDPEGDTIKTTLLRFGYPVTDFHIGHEMVMELDVDDDEYALKIAGEACEKILVNPILHNYSVEII
jgi:phosphoribosylformylglycinamidine synthase